MLNLSCKIGGGIFTPCHVFLFFIKQQLDKLPLQPWFIWGPRIRTEAAVVYAASEGSFRALKRWFYPKSIAVFGSRAEGENIWRRRLGKVLLSVQLSWKLSHFKALGGGDLHSKVKTPLQEPSLYTVYSSVSHIKRKIKTTHKPPPPLPKLLLSRKQAGALVHLIQVSALCSAWLWQKSKEEPCWPRSKDWSLVMIICALAELS